MLTNLILAKDLVSLILPVVTNCVLIHCFISVIRASTVLPNLKFRISVWVFIFVHTYKTSSLAVSWKQSARFTRSVPSRDKDKHFRRSLDYYRLMLLCKIKDRKCYICIKQNLNVSKQWNNFQLNKWIFTNSLLHINTSVHLKWSHLWLPIHEQISYTIVWLVYE